MNKEKMDRWIEAMESGKFKPVGGALIGNYVGLSLTGLAATRGMEALTEGYRNCCLGVHIIVNENAEFERCRDKQFAVGGSGDEALNVENQRVLELDLGITKQERDDLNELEGAGAEGVNTRMDALIDINDGHIPQAGVKDYAPIVKFIRDHGWDRPQEG